MESAEPVGRLNIERSMRGVRGGGAAVCGYAGGGSEGEGGDATVDDTAAPWRCRTSGCLAAVCLAPNPRRSASAECAGGFLPARAGGGAG